MLQINPTLSFKTAQGSEYFVQGCVTQRNKYQHLLHDVDDKGWKQPSQFTVYIDSETAKKLAPKIAFWHTHRLCYFGNKLVLVTVKKNGSEKTVRPISAVEHSLQPKKGLSPIEFWEFTEIGRVENKAIYYPNKIHIGNPIVEITSLEGAIV